MTPDFRETEEGWRYTIADAVRIELLDRLLELNHERYRDEVARGLHDTGRRKKTPSNARGGRTTADELSLFDGLVTA